MTGKRTPQEEFWEGSFGDEYLGRDRDMLANNTAFFSHILARMENVRSVIEFGANIGLNLQAIRILRPQMELSAIEINRKAADMLRNLGEINVYHMSIFDFIPDYQRDFVFTKGVLIHINPEKLSMVYDLLHRTSRRYICLAEYFNTTPVSVEYRGHRDVLFKRDFAGELLDRFEDLRLRDYGFVYRRDVFPQSDITWFLLEKTGAACG